MTDRLDENAELMRRRYCLSSASGDVLWEKDGIDDFIVDSGYRWKWDTLVECPSNGSMINTFIQGGNLFFSLVSGAVKIFNTTTGSLVAKISAPTSLTAFSTNDGLSGPISVAILHAHNPFQILTASEDGFIRTWDYVDGSLLDTIYMGIPMYQMCTHACLDDHVLIASSGNPINSNDMQPRPFQQNIMAQITKVSLRSRMDNGQQRPEAIFHLGGMDRVAAMTISPNGAWFVVIGGRKVRIWRTSLFDEGFTTFSSPENLTCLAFHPTSEYFATGDESGKIRLWYCLNGHMLIDIDASNQKSPTTILHWHAHAVSSLAFTSNGAYLLSGGEEGVLVIWQIHSGSKEFLPRLGAAITHIAIKDKAGAEEFLLSMANDSYIFINANTLTVSRVYNRVRMDSFRPTQLSQSATVVPLAYHCRSSSFILPSSDPSLIQSYSLIKSSVMTSIEVSPSNRASRREGKPVGLSRVESVVISHTGEWMVTVDRKDGSEGQTCDVQLKFWHCSSSDWALNTRVNRPHGLAKITDMAFSPRAVSEQAPVLVTAGSDGMVKAWCLSIDVKQTGLIEGFWAHKSSIFFQRESPSAVCWSPDASLLCVAFGPYVVIYQSSSNKLIDTLICTEISGDDSLSLRFVGASGRHLLVAGRNNAVLWDLTRRSIIWHFYSPDGITHIIPHPRLETLALFIRLSYKEHNMRGATLVICLRAAICEPKKAVILPFSLLSVIWYPHSTDDFISVGITDSWSLVAIEDTSGDGTRETLGSARSAADSAISSRSIFRDIFGKSTLLDDRSNIEASYGVSRSRSKSTTFLTGGVSYLAPPIDTVYSTYIGNFLPKIPQGQLLDKHAADTQVEQLYKQDEDEGEIIPSNNSSNIIQRMDATDFEAYTVLFSTLQWSK